MKIYEGTVDELREAGLLPEERTRVTPKSDLAFKRSPVVYKPAMEWKPCSVSMVPNSVTPWVPIQNSNSIVEHSRWFAQMSPIKASTNVGNKVHEFLIYRITTEARGSEYFLIAPHSMSPPEIENRKGRPVMGPFASRGSAQAEADDLIEDEREEADDLIEDEMEMESEV